MDTSSETRLPNSSGKIIKTILLFIGRCILVLLGFLVLIIMIIDIFEGEFSFLEISFIEIFFVFVLFFVVKNYLYMAKRHNLDWRQTFYRPLRNLGWYGMMALVLTILALISDDGISSSMEYENISQIIDYIIISLCIYFATPKEVDHKNDIPREEVKS